MTISGESIGLIVGIMTLVGAFISIVKFVVTMREQIRTLFKKVEEIKESKDEDVKGLKQSLKDLDTQMSAMKDAYLEANQNLVKTINDNHIKLLEKIS